MFPCTCSLQFRHVAAVPDTSCPQSGHRISTISALPLCGRLAPIGHPAPYSRKPRSPVRVHRADLTASSNRSEKRSANRAACPARHSCVDGGESDGGLPDAARRGRQGRSRLRRVDQVSGPTLFADPPSPRFGYGLSRRGCTRSRGPLRARAGRGAVTLPGLEELPEVPEYGRSLVTEAPVIVSAGAWRPTPILGDVTAPPPAIVDHSRTDPWRVDNELERGDFLLSNLVARAYRARSPCLQ